MTRAERDRLRAEVATRIEEVTATTPPTLDVVAKMTFSGGAYVVRMLGLSGSATEGWEAALRSWARAVRRAEAKAAA